MERTKKIIEKELNKAIKKRVECSTKTSIKTLSVKFITCKRCESKLNREKIKGEYCPLCGYDLRQAYFQKEIDKLSQKIKDLREELENLEEVIILNEKEGFRISNYDIIPKSRPAYQKILDYMKEKYGSSFNYSNCTANEKFIVAVNPNYIHMKTYFSALFDIHIFDKNGNLLAFKNNVISGPAYSDFFVDRLYFDSGIFKLEIRNHLSPYSKCSDEYGSIWHLNFDETTVTNFNVRRNHFIFVERHSERDYAIINEKQSNHYGNYFMFADLKGHSALDVSENTELFNQLYNKAFK